MSRKLTHRLVICASTHPRAPLTSTDCRKAGGCSGLVVVETRNGSLCIGLACRCGYSRSWTVELGPDECLTLDGSAVQLEKFSHRHSA
jgi:hypothetical protein